MMESNSSEESDEWVGDDEWADLPETTRRRLLKKSLGGAAAAGLVGAAGCQGDGQDGTDTVTPLGNEGDGGDGSDGSDGSDGGGGGDGGDGGDDATDTAGGQYVDGTLDHIIGIAPDNARFNPYGSSANWSFRWYWAMFDQWAVHDKYDNATKGMILKDWEYQDDGTVIFNIRDSYTWHDGSDLTAEDAVTQLKLGQLMQTVNKGYGAQPLYENVQQTGDYELQFELKDAEISREIFEFGHLKRRGWFWAHRDHWGEFAERFTDASSDSERDDVRADLQETVKRPPWDNSQVPGNSIWEMTEGDSNTALMEAYDDYWSPFSEHSWADGDITGDMIDYDLRWRRYPNQQQRTQAMKEEIIDVSYPPNSESARQEIRELGWRPANDLTEDQIVPTMRAGGNGLFFNCQSDSLTGDRRVRQAIMHVVPRQQMMSWHTDYGNYWIHDRHITGLGQDKEVPWFGGPENWPNDTLQSFEQYAASESDVDTDRATQLLQDAGFSKSGGRWKDPDGNNVTLRLYTATSDEEPMALRYSQIAKEYLDSFGLNTEVTAQESTIRAGETMDSGDWDIMFDAWGGAKSAPPTLDWNTTFPMTKTLAGEDVPNAGAWALEPEVEVPYPVGDPDGDLQTVNINDKRRQLRRKMSGEERQERVNELAWIFNQTVPWFTVNEEGGSGGYWVNKSRWRTYPPQGQDNPAYKYEIIEIGQYSYAHYMGKMGNEWFGPVPEGEADQWPQG
ncbi:ABC transporter substrate-binding protein [Halosimplex amylolyticum]|uniref:ABC transporter substrate-binding protein n=1 Tax=Halosimplex amylolyticum TaxID=3396616 RepID=UPI003F5433D4